MVPSSPTRRRALRVGVLLLFAIGAYQLWLLGHILYWNGHDPEMTSFMRARLAEMREENPDAELLQKWVPYGRISNSLKRAVVAAEDIKFLRHEGFDWEGIGDALERNLKKGRIVAGGSTISQQLAKNLFLSGGRTPWRKAQEAVITLMLETVMTKRRILEIYLNVIEWGEGVFGVRAAARHYFGVAPGGLTADQAAWLAASIPNPRYYDRRRGDPTLVRRARIIRYRMGYVRVP